MIKLGSRLRIAICEDNEKDLAILTDHIKQSGISADCALFNSGENLMADFYPDQYDLIFLDIYLGGFSGINAAERVRKIDGEVLIVFTTTSTDHALESYRLKAPRYLEKPLKPGEVVEALKLALDKRKKVASINLLIQGKYLDIPLGKIIYFEQKNNAVQINTTKGLLQVSQTVRISAIAGTLPTNFLHCHHSYIINLNYVKGIDHQFKVFNMANGDRVHIRHKSFKEVVSKYEDHLFCKARGGEFELE